MGKLKTFAHICLGFTIGVVGTTGGMSYVLYKNYKNIEKLKDETHKTGNMSEFDSAMIQQTLEGAMLNELKSKGSYLKTPSYQFDLGDAEILKYHKGDNRLIVYIRDMHEEEDLQEKIYKTIDELRKENGIDLLVLENFLNKEVTKENLDLIINNFPVKILHLILHGFWTPKNEDEVSKILDAGFAYEYIEGNKIETYGAEDEDIYETSSFIALRSPPKSEGKIWLHKEVILEKRSEIDVKNTIKRMKETEKDKSIFICGAAHTKGIIKSLEKEGVSYLILQPKGLDEKLKMLLYRP